MRTRVPPGEGGLELLGNFGERQNLMGEEPHARGAEPEPAIEVSESELEAAQRAVWLADQVKDEPA